MQIVYRESAIRESLQRPAYLWPFLCMWLNEYATLRRDQDELTTNIRTGKGRAVGIHSAGS
jgi:hypothetical protein